MEAAQHSGNYIFVSCMLMSLKPKREGCTFGLPCNAFHTCARWIFEDF